MTAAMLLADIKHVKEEKLRKLKSVAEDNKKRPLCLGVHLSADENITENRTLPTEQH